jgi:predicted glycogen debranching enzyme
LVASFDDTALYADFPYSLATLRWASGVIQPQGFLNIESFHLDGTVPVWTYTIGDASIEKRVWMRHGENTTYVQYTFLRGIGSLELSIKAFANYRDFHGATHAPGDWGMDVTPIPDGVRILAFEGATPFFVRSSAAACEPHHEWYRDFLMPEETARGLDDREERLFAAHFRATLQPGGSATFSLSTDAHIPLDAQSAYAEHEFYDADLFHAWQNSPAPPLRETPPWIWPLISAADQFIVKRALPDQPDTHSILAGYHWFDDWGRDAMISIPGLTLVTGRAGIAKQILFAFAHYLDGGLLPNNFPGSGAPPQYNSVDAALWFFEAVRQYFAVTSDLKSLQTLFPAMLAIIDAYLKGTRFNIHTDPDDSLLYAGDSGTQLTWMDAKACGTPVTPRAGKPVEVNALWINALETMSACARLVGQPSESYARLGARAQINFQKFWTQTINIAMT